MCTVTFIPNNDGFYFTSSRDEKASRSTLPPNTYIIDGINLIFPKDEMAGGTWIASSLQGKTACLLNGAFINHHKRTDYVRSRGLILLDSFNYNTALEFSENIDLKDVEPFTLLTLDYSSGKLTEFYEFRWDGENKHLKNLSQTTNQIWSSATLYSPAIQDARQQLFSDWLLKNEESEDKLILNFHNRKHGLSLNEDILMKGEGDLRTVSISQIHFQNSKAVFNYFDIEENKEYKLKLNNSLTHA